ncbi:hypothetical protein ESCG_04667, partial [Escherichia sp. 1_1_43]
MNYAPACSHYLNNYEKSPHSLSLPQWR